MKNMSTIKSLSLAAAAMLGLSASLHAQTLLNETFTSNVTFTGWNWTGGSFQNPPSFDEAWNQNSTTNQFFTHAFTSTTLNDGDSLRVSFNYNPNSVNIDTVRVGLFNGTAATTDGWDQWSGTNGVSSTWVGYTGVLATLSGNNTIGKDSATGNHPFWDAGNLNTAASSGLGTGALRAAEFSLARSGSTISLTLKEGATFGSLSTLLTASDSSSAITNFNILSFYMSTTSGNGDMRYDNVLVEYSAIPEPTSAVLLGLGAVVGMVVSRRRRR
jgi:hypothetical protein